MPRPASFGFRRGHKGEHEPRSLIGWSPERMAKLQSYALLICDRNVVEKYKTPEAGFCGITSQLGGNRVAGPVQKLFHPHDAKFMH